MLYIETVWAEEARRLIARAGSRLHGLHLIVALSSGGQSTRRRENRKCHRDTDKG